MMQAYYVEYLVRHGATRDIVGERVYAQNQFDVIRMVKMRWGFDHITKYPVKV